MDPLRFSGLASGIDTDAIIKQLMAAHRQPVNRLEQQKQLLQWKQDAYRDIYAKIQTFRNNALFDMRLERNLIARKVDISGYADAVSVTATGSTQIGTLHIEVGQLATAASNKSSSAITTAADFDPSKALATQATKLEGSLGQTNPPVYDLVKFSINGHEIVVDPNKDSLNDVIARINRETNVTAFYSYHSTQGGRISFVSKETGKVHGPDGDQAYIAFEDIEGSFLTDILKITDPGTAAVNAEATVNGLLVESTSNTLTVNGAEIILKAVTGSNPATVVQITSDTDALVEKVKSFIEAYNELIGKLYEVLEERQYRDFPPLTKEQREEMSDKEIELWEQRAKSGLLRNDLILSSAISNMRLAIAVQVDTGNPSVKSLSAIGIETGSYNEKGKLYLQNEDKLRQAIAADPEAFIALFAASGDGSGDRSKMGIAERIYQDLNNVLEQVKEKAGIDIGLKVDNSMIGRQLKSIDDQIQMWNRRLLELENRYYRQFTAMERAISMYNSQSMYLMNLFGGTA